MAQIIHDISNPNDGLGDPLRTAFDNQNDMNTELYTTKVDKVTGQRLTENNFSDADKEKLDGLTNSTQVQSDWAQDDFDAVDYIKNKDNVELSLNKISSIETYSETLYPNEKAVHDLADTKLNVSDLPSNLTFYPTTATADVSGYFKLVDNVTDADYDEPAVDVSTGTITTTDQLISSLISDAGLLSGNPGIVNITTVGNIKRVSGTGTADFFVRAYHRDSLGVETLVGTSNNTEAVSNSTYEQFSATLLWNDGEFAPTDRVVLKFYANRISGGGNPTYEFQFGGDAPVRTIFPVPFFVVAGEYELKANKQNNLNPDGTGLKYPTVDGVNAEVVKLTGNQTVQGVKTFVEPVILADGSDITFKSGIFEANLDIATLTENKSISLQDKSGVIALTSDVDLKQNLLPSPTTGERSSSTNLTYALQDGTILYHSVKWFTPSSTVSTSGVTVTSVGTQFTSEMVGAKITINGESRIITAFTSSTVVTVGVAFNTNYSGVVAGNWGVYNKGIILTNTGGVVVSSYNSFDIIVLNAPVVAFGGAWFDSANGIRVSDVGAELGLSDTIRWAQNDSPNVQGQTKDLGLRRNTAGVLEIYDGINANGLEANRRDLYLRTLTATDIISNALNLGKSVINASVTGTYNIDWNNDTYDIVLTGNTTFTESNLPASGKTKVISIYVTGNFALTLPANWATNVIGTYSTTKLNQLVVEYRGATKYWLTINQGQ